MNTFTNDSAAHPTLTVWLPDSQKKWYSMNGGWKAGEGGLRWFKFPSWFLLDLTFPSWRLASLPSDASFLPPSVVDQHISAWDKCYFLVHPGFISLPVRKNQRIGDESLAERGFLLTAGRKGSWYPRKKRGEGRETENSLPHLIKSKHGLYEVEKQSPCSRPSLLLCLGL